LRGQGEEILQVLVKAEHDGLYSGSTWVGGIVRRIGWATDGRSVTPTLMRLQRHKLVERDDQGGGRKQHWRPTARGREVDAILDKIVVERGGQFVPFSQAGIDFYEAGALR
jgi:hypothetical protein